MQQPEDIQVHVHPGSGDDDDETMVFVTFSSEEADDIHYLMPATEYLMYLTATRSNLGFERALDLLCKGAMTWRTRKNE